MLWYYDYDAFGNQKEIAGQYSSNDTNPLRYAGEYYDKETGNIYLRARYYSPAASRMLSEDTHWNPRNMIYGDNPRKFGDVMAPNIAAIMQASNLYVYCMNNPILYFDPNGLAVCLIHGTNLFNDPNPQDTWTSDFRTYISEQFDNEKVLEGN